MPMTMRHAVGAGLIGAFILACGGPAAPSGVPSSLPSSLPTLPSNLPTLPSELPTLPSGLPSIPPVSFTPDQALEDLFPDTVGGNPVDVQSASGASVAALLNQTDPAKFEEFLTRINATVDQLSAARSFHLWPGATADEFTGLTIFALRVRDVPAANTLQSFVTVVESDVPNAQVGTATLGGKSVTAITNPENEEDNAYLYAAGDVVFLVGGTPALVEEAFTQLP